MEKVFNFVYPDEPLKTTTENNNNVEIKYYGPRYILVQLYKDNMSVSYASDNYEDVYQVMRSYDHDDHKYRIIDADESPIIASILTEEYDHDPVPVWEEELPDGSFWSFPWDSNNMINHCIKESSIKWDLENNKLRTFEFIEPTSTREEVDSVYKQTAQEIRDSLSKNSFSEEDRKTLEDAAHWFENWQNLTKGYDYWKAQPPTELPDY